MKRLIRKAAGALAIVMAVIMILPMGITTAKADIGDAIYITPKQLVETLEARPTETLDYTVPIVIHNQAIMNPFFYLDTEGTPFEQVGDVELVSYNPSVMSIMGEHRVTFKIKVKETAKAGTYGFKLVCEGVDLGNDEMVTVAMNRPIRVKVVDELKPAKLYFENITVEKEANIGGKTAISFDVRNRGNMAAEDVVISVSAGSGFVREFDTSKLLISSLEAGQVKSFDLDFAISAYATEGISRIGLSAKYISGDDVSFESTDYADVEVKALNSESTSKKFAISDFTVTRQVKAGGTATIAFTLKNKFNNYVSDINVTVPSMAEHGFIPEFNSKTLNIKEMDAKDNKSVVLNYTLIENAPLGLKTIPIVVNYKDADGNSGYATEYAYIEVVESDEKSSTPKLIISDFDMGEDVLKAGSTFDFSFDVTNTNRSVTARNIKVTLSSTDNVFSVTEGSNSFYIESIAPGGVNHNVIPLKVKNDCTTKAYPLSIKFNYEYEGMPTVENQVAPGVDLEEVLNLQVQENSRPVVNNIYVGGWDVAKVGELTTVSFEFYNMGKAVLSNVTARVVSDALTPTGDMVYIGNVEAGNGENFEVEVTPNYGGEINGILVITYEDSNGEPVEMETPFTGNVEEPMSFDDFGGDMGFDPGMMDDMPMDEGQSGSKKPIVIAVIVIVVAAAVCIFVLAKRNRKKKNAEVLEDDEE